MSSASFIFDTVKFAIIGIYGIQMYSGIGIGAEKLVFIFDTHDTPRCLPAFRPLNEKNILNFLYKMNRSLSRTQESQFPKEKLQKEFKHS